MVNDITHLLQFSLLILSFITNSIIVIIPIFWFSYKLYLFISTYDYYMGQLREIYKNE